MRALILAALLLPGFASAQVCSSIREWKAVQTDDGYTRQIVPVCLDVQKIGEEGKLPPIYITFDGDEE